jgi:hypothetical protein
LKSGECCPPGRVSDDCKPHSTLHDSQGDKTGEFDAMVGSECLRQLLEDFEEFRKRLRVSGGEVLSLGVEDRLGRSRAGRGFSRLCLRIHPSSFLLLIHLLLPIFYAIYIYPPPPPVKIISGCNKSTNHALKPPPTLPSLVESPATLLSRHSPRSCLNTKRSIPRGMKKD